MGKKNEAWRSIWIYGKSWDCKYGYSRGKSAARKNMALIPHNNNYWWCTIASRPKMQQFKANDKFEFCSIIRKDESLGSICACGKAKIIEDFEVK